MARRKAAAQAAPAGDDGRTIYAVAKGVDMVNGHPVTEGAVRLTTAEALYDQALGRISPQPAVQDGTSDDRA
ncbi:hypothetical protein [Rhizobium straminoryzae]|uniref:Uncharacterized protein n=1 Tax=Rhizobium straminoryzae TaxID=1387186 RepID=A0A549T0U3_9HYPH|nr:hypothetical protein [Rhizobium straminoryzae]TRL35495.1 hypothetical protein FNA46_20045 [Rhizobium straminoryzae]